MITKSTSTSSHHLVPVTTTPQASIIFPLVLLIHAESGNTWLHHACPLSEPEDTVPVSPQPVTSTYLFYCPTPSHPCFCLGLACDGYCMWTWVQLRHPWFLTFFDSFCCSSTVVVICNILQHFLIFMFLFHQFFIGFVFYLCFYEQGDWLYLTIGSHILCYTLPTFDFMPWLVLWWSHPSKTALHVKAGQPYLCSSQ